MSQKDVYLHTEIDTDTPPVAERYIPLSFLKGTPAAADFPFFGSSWGFLSLPNLCWICGRGGWMGRLDVCFTLEFGASWFVARSHVASKRSPWPALPGSLGQARQSANRSLERLTCEKIPRSKKGIDREIFNDIILKIGNHVRVGFHSAYSMYIYRYIYILPHIYIHAIYA